MKRWLLLVLLLSGSVTAEETLSLSAYLRQLSETEGFELNGTNLIAASDTVVSRQGVNVDLALTYSLRHYNFVVSYAAGRVSRVWITGRKGSTTGPLPETVEAAVAEALDETSQ